MKKSLIVSLLCTALCAAIFAQTGNDFEIKQNAKGGITITKYIGNIKDVIIPSTIEGIKVTEIGELCFGREQITRENITSVTIPNSVNNIGSGAFYECTKLTSINIPASVTNIEGYAFSGCTGLASITIPNSVTSIGEHAFSHCSSLVSITIPNSVTKIENNAFFRCAYLSSITIAANKNYANEFSDTFAAYYESQGKKAGTYLWSGRLWRIATAAELEQAKKEAESKAKMEAEAKEAQAKIEAEAKTTQARIEAEAKAIGFQVASNGMGFIINKYIGKEKIVEIPLSIHNIPVISIGYGAFEDCTSLTNITIPNSVTIIGSNAFSSCTSLISITIPNSITSIGDEAFVNCTSLTSVTFQGKITSDEINPSAFVGDLRAKYLSGGAGTYTRPNGKSNTWKKSK